MSRQAYSILFVDDEKDILSSLRRLFLDEDWNMFFAQSGSEGLEVLYKNHIDLVVSDARMPGMDGIAFLKEVKQLYPAVIRIMLSGYADNRAVTKALVDGSAQQIVSKPWDEAFLLGVIHSALDQAERQREKHRGLQKIINSLSALPSLPSIYIKVSKMLADPLSYSLDEIASVIGQDIALSAELIRWANSAAFGQTHQVDTIKRAFAVLGTDIIKGIILSRSALNILPAKLVALHGFDRAEFQKHCLGVAIIANRLLKKSAPAEPKLADQAFTAGLLHDLGKLVEVAFLYKQFQRILEMASTQKTVISQAEMEILGTTHEEIGGYLAAWWDMPPFLVTAIQQHHSPSPSSDNREIVAAVHVADMLAHQFAIGTSGNFCTPTVDAASLSHFNLSDEYMEILRKEGSEWASQE